MLFTESMIKKFKADFSSDSEIWKKEMCEISSKNLKEMNIQKMLRLRYKFCRWKRLRLSNLIFLLVK